MLVCTGVGSWHPRAMTGRRLTRGLAGIVLLTACGGRAVDSDGHMSGEERAAGNSGMGDGASPDGDTSVGGRAATGNAGRGTMLPAQGGNGIGPGGTGASLSGGAAATPSVPGSAGESASCADVEPCGGKLEGAWMVAGSCLEVTGVADITPLGLGCSTVPVQGTLFVTGNFSVDAQGAVVDRTITAGNVRFSLSRPCLNVSGTVVECSRVAPVFHSLGYELAECSLIGGVCECNASVNQAGTMGLVATVASTEGHAKADQQSFHVSAVEATESYSYCANGDNLLVTPWGGGLRGTISGTVSLERH